MPILREMHDELDRSLRADLAADTVEQEELDRFELNRGKGNIVRNDMQKKTFTKWVNKHLSKAGMNVEDLFEDLRDGTALIALLEALTDESIQKENGKTRFHRIQNVQTCLDFLKNKRVKLVNIRSEDIVDGNGKLTMGLIWTIILHFQVSVIRQRLILETQNEIVESKSAVVAAETSESCEKVDVTSARVALLQMAQKVTADYPLVKVTNFSSSWRDGLAFNAIIHHYRPTVIDWIRISGNSVSNRERLDNAFSVAEKEFEVPRLLDAEDVDTNNPDEKSIITYVSSLYNALPQLPALNKWQKENEEIIEDASESDESVEVASQSDDDNNLCQDNSSFDDNQIVIAANNAQDESMNTSESINEIKEEADDTGKISIETVVRNKRLENWEWQDWKERYVAWMDTSKSHVTDLFLDPNHTGLVSRHEFIDRVIGSKFPTNHLEMESVADKFDEGNGMFNFTSFVEHLLSESVAEAGMVVSELGEMKSLEGCEWQDWKERFMTWMENSKSSTSNLFHHSDPNHAGLIPRQEFIDRVIQTEFPTSHLEMEKVAEMLDRGDGMIDFTKFIEDFNAFELEKSVVLNWKFQDWKDRFMAWIENSEISVTDLFVSIDPDQKGLVPRQLFVNGLITSTFPTNKLEMEKVAERFDNGDGMINLKEFIENFHPESISKIETVQNVKDGEVSVDALEVKSLENWNWQEWKVRYMAWMESAMITVEDLCEAIDPDKNGLVYHQVFIDEMIKSEFPTNRLEMEKVADLFDNEDGMVDFTNFAENISFVSDATYVFIPGNYSRDNEAESEQESVKRQEEWAWQDWKDRYIAWMDDSKIQIADLFRNIEIAQTGLIPRQVFIDEVINSNFPTSQPEMEKVADKFDKGDGMINLKEFIEDCHPGIIVDSETDVLDLELPKSLENWEWQDWKDRFMSWMKNSEINVTDLFVSIDPDRKGLVPRQLFIDGFIGSTFPTNQIEMEKVAKQFDNGDGMIDFTEFVEDIGLEKCAEPVVDSETVTTEIQLEDLPLQVSESDDEVDVIAKNSDLLQWTQKVTAEYPLVKIVDFSSSWRDGHAFNAIIHHFCPSAIDYSKINDSLSNGERLDNAFSVAEKEFGVARILSAEDVDTDSPDEKLIISYISSLQNLLLLWSTSNKNEEDREACIEKLDPHSEGNHIRLEDIAPTLDYKKTEKEDNVLQTSSVRLEEKESDTERIAAGLEWEDWKEQFVAWIRNGEISLTDLFPHVDQNNIDLLSRQTFIDKIIESEFPTSQNEIEKVADKFDNGNGMINARDFIVDICLYENKTLETGRVQAELGEQTSQTTELININSSTSEELTLLQTIQEITANYPLVNVTNFSSSWRDGLAFNAIIHHYCPTVINWNQISEDSVSDSERLENAFSVAEKEFGAPRLLRCEDVDTYSPNEKSIRNYVTSLLELLGSAHENLPKEHDGLVENISEESPPTEGIDQDPRFNNQNLSREKCEIEPHLNDQICTAAGVHQADVENSVQTPFNDAQSADDFLVENEESESDELGAQIEFEEMKRLENSEWQDWKDLYVAWIKNSKISANDLFEHFDPNGAGLIPRQAFIDNMIESEFPTTRHEMEKVAEMFDNGDGMVDFAKFVSDIRFKVRFQSDASSGTIQANFSQKNEDESEQEELKRLENWIWQDWKARYIAWMVDFEIQVADLFRNIESDHIGLIPRQVFIDEVINSNFPTSQPEMEKVADKFDKGDGMINLEEFIEDCHPGIIVDSETDVLDLELPKSLENWEWQDWKDRFMSWMKNSEINVTDLFVSIDPDKKGLVPRQLFIDGFIGSTFPTNQLEMEKVAEQFDNGDGMIDFTEFVEDIGLEKCAEPVVDSETVTTETQLEDLPLQVSESDDEVDVIAKNSDLLQWTQKVTAEYPLVKIVDFSSSWRDGHAFNAIIHHFCPSAIDYSKINDSLSNGERLDNAFSVAEKEFGVARILRAEDVDTDSPDEKLIIIYIWSLRNIFHQQPSYKKVESTKYKEEWFDQKSHSSEWLERVGPQIQDQNLRQEASNTEIGFEVSSEPAARADQAKTSKKSSSKTKKFNKNIVEKGDNAEKISIELQLEEVKRLENWEWQDWKERFIAWMADSNISSTHVSHRIDPHRSFFVPRQVFIDGVIGMSKEVIFRLSEPEFVSEVPTSRLEMEKVADKFGGEMIDCGEFIDEIRPTNNVESEIVQRKYSREQSTSQATESTHTSSATSDHSSFLQTIQEITDDYPLVNVTNFSSSWRDGLAFNAIIHHYCPTVINWSKISDNAVSNRERLENAFRAAEKEFGVSRLLDAEDVDTDNSDESLIVSYVSSLLNALPLRPFSRKWQKENFEKVSSSPYSKNRNIPLKKGSEPHRNRLDEANEKAALDELAAQLELEEMKRLENWKWQDWKERYVTWLDDAKSRVTDMFRRIDSDHTGLVPRQVFIDGVIGSKFPTSRLEMAKVADRFDKGDGVIDSKEFINAIRFERNAAPETDPEKINHEIERQKDSCSCCQLFHMEKISDNHYKFGDTQIKRMVRILRSTVMVRVGGGWETLEEFVQKHDPCRAKGRLNTSKLPEVKPSNASDSMRAFTKNRHALPMPGTPGPIVKIKEKTDRSVPMSGGVGGTAGYSPSTPAEKGKKEHRCQTPGSSKL